MNLETRYNYIFCDLDGPILDGRWRHYECYRTIVEEFGGTVIPIEEYWEMKRSKVKRTVLLEKTKFEGTYEDYFRRWMDLIEEDKYLQMDVLKPYAKEALRYLKEHTDYLCLVTLRNNIVNLDRQLVMLQIKDMFDQILVGNSFLNKSSKYELVKDIHFSSAVVIGDTEADSELANSLGVKLIGITNGLRKKELLQTNWYVAELKDLIGEMGS